jgi:TRAP-type mannitol/chloroaromatic compound transport system substrate-binding protein
VAELSGGRLKVETMPAGTIVPAFEVLDAPSGEIIPAAERGVIDCAEWVGGVEDLRLGFHTVWKYHYAPGRHEKRHDR